MDDAYNALKIRKRKNESFSEVIRRVTKDKGSIMELAGAWKDISKEDAEKMKKKILEMRKGTRLKELYGKM